MTPEDHWPKTFEVTVHDDKPIWGYCQQGAPPMTHCQSGMVFGINAPKAGNTFDAFLQNAKKSVAQNGPALTSSPSWPHATTSSPSWPHETTTTTWSHSSGSGSMNGGWKPKTHQVIVGGVNPAKFFYYPQNITADVGDEVEFIFMAKNHT